MGITFEREQVFLNTCDFVIFNKRCVFYVIIIGVCVTGFLWPRELKQVHVSLRLPPWIQTHKGEGLGLTQPLLLC